MSEDKKRQITSPQGGVFHNVGLQIKLILRLLADRRVNIFLKLLPVGALLYFLIPDLAPGPIDDALVIWLGGFLFIELCPPHVVQEHMDELSQVIPGELKDPPEAEGDIIDAEFWEED
jgi:hypothetical protein